MAVSYKECSIQQYAIYIRVRPTWTKCQLFYNIIKFNDMSSSNSHRLKDNFETETDKNVKSSKL